MSFSIERDSTPESPEAGRSVAESAGGKPADVLPRASSRVSDKAHVVLSPGRRDKRLRDQEGASSAILRALAATFLVVGVVDLILLWSPAQLGNAAWEFATVSRTLDSLPMLAMGAGLYAFGVVIESKPNRIAARRVAVGSVILMLAVVLVGAIYGTAAPAVLGAAPTEALDGVRRALVKGTLQLVAYCALFAAIALTLWKRLPGSG